MTDKYDAMYEYLSGFADSSFDDICSYFDEFSQSDFETFLENLAPLIPEDRFEDDSVFNYSVDSTLEGGPFPCKEYSCRLSNVRNLARFSTLYSDKILIRCPIDQAFANCHTDYVDVEELAFGIYSTIQLEKPVKAGYLGFSSGYVPLCNDCMRKQLDLESAASNFLNDAWNEIVRGFHESTKCVLHAYDDGSLYVEIEGMGDYGSHEIIDVSFKQDPPSLVELYQAKGSVLLNGKDLSRGGIDALLIPMLNDSLYALTSPSLYGGSYLTTKPVQIQLLESAKTAVLRKTEASASYEQIDLGLPFAQEASIESMIHVRQTNEEEFQVFRDAIRRGLAELASSNDVAADVKRDIIDPEIHKLELTLRNGKRRFVTTAGVEAAVGAAGLTIGSYFGLPVESIASILSAMGVGSLVPQVIDAATKNSIRNNPMYFLWRITR